jgi:hypothetical protein
MNEPEEKTLAQIGYEARQEYYRKCEITKWHRPTWADLPGYMQRAEEEAAKAISLKQCLTTMGENASEIRRLKKALALYKDAYPHRAPDDCFATGPKTGDPYLDLVVCPGCEAEKAARAALATSKQSLQVEHLAQGFEDIRSDLRQIVEGA